MDNMDVIITGIHSALVDIEFLEEMEQASFFPRQTFKKVRFRLRNLKTFVLIYGRGLGSEGSFRSLLVRIEDTVCKNAELIHLHCLHFNGPTTDLHHGMASEFDKDIISLKDKIDEAYANTLDYTRQSITRGEVLEIISSLFDSLVDFRSILMYQEFEFEHLSETIEVFEGQMLFMKRVIVLASNTSLESIQGLLAHAESITMDASYLLFNFISGEWEDYVTKMSALLRKMKPIDSHVYEAYTRPLKRPFLGNDNDAFIAIKDLVDSLIFSLWELLRLSSWMAAMKDLQELYEALRSFRAILKQQPFVKINQVIGDAICDVGVFICSLHRAQRDADHVLGDLLAAIRSILAEIRAEEPQLPMFSFPSQEDRFSKSIKSDVLKTSPAGIKQGFEVKNVPSLGAFLRRDEVVGFQDDERLVVDGLTRGSLHLRIIAIVGMPGLGKTTLANKVYTNPSVSLHFHVRALCHVSQVVDKKKVLLDLLKLTNVSSTCYQMSTEQDLEDKLRKSLKGRRYLVFLDDMWDIKAWNSFKQSFPDDNVGSRIILTSRQHDIVPRDLMVGGKPHRLHQLTEEESMELLNIKLSSGNGFPSLSLDLGMKIVEKCRGLPLLIVIVAGVLKTIEAEGWDEILDSLGNVPSTEQWSNTLELSYKHLPPYLRPCLLYFGAFQEDKEISVRRLICLWTAEGFVQKDDTKSVEDTAECYLKDLIDRSLIMVAKQRSLGGVKSCRIHDLLRDFCLQKAKEEHFFHFLKGPDELSAFNEPNNLQRLCIHSDVDNFKQSRLFCPHARSLILNSPGPRQGFIQELGWCYMSSAIGIFKLLRVLDLEQVHFGFRFPSEIELLVLLVFLAIRSNAYEIPCWIGNLSSLETFIFQGDSFSDLPESFWNLKKLKNLYVGIRCVCYLPHKNLDISSTLHALDWISGVFISYRKMESLIRKFPNIRTLKCRLVYRGDDSCNLLVPDILSRIESLSMSYDNETYPAPVIAFVEFSMPAILKKLTLKDFNLSWRNISIIGELPNLEVLKLVRIRFEGETWEMKEEEFPKLRFLKLVSLNLIKWCTDGVDQLNCFQKLVLDGCSSLEEMPYCLDTILTLEIIEIYDCYYTVVDLVRQIEGRREELMGDSGLKIITNNIRNWRTT